MPTRIKIDPVTRIEGHLALEAVVDGGVVKDAKSSGTLFRGFEIILRGRDPRDANRLTQRICGVCPTAHATASALCIDEAFGLTDKIPGNGALMRALIFGANFLQSHILHFYHLAALDYVDAAGAVGRIGPFVPRYEGDYRVSGEANAALVGHYVRALDVRRKCQEMLSIFGGKMPHNVGIVPGGVTETPTEDKIANFLWRLNEIRQFIDSAYIPDVLAVAKAYGDYAGIGRGCGRLLSYGGFNLPGGSLFSPGTVGGDLEAGKFEPGKITEDVTSSWYADSSSGRHPSEGETEPAPAKKGAYSFLKSPRYGSEVFEVGPLARMACNYASGHGATRSIMDNFFSETGLGAGDLFSVLGRHAARALEAVLVADAMAGWLLALKPSEPAIVEHSVPESGRGAGLTEAPRGAVGHWITVADSKIDRYQVITPTAWNASPRDGRGRPGPLEQAIIGTRVKDTENPFELVRIIRAFDPCLACSVHTVDAAGRGMKVFRVV
jgi:hydrogenase large subunit